MTGGKQNLSLWNRMMCLGQPAVQQGMNGKTVKLTDFFLSVKDGKKLGQSLSLSAVIHAYISLPFPLPPVHQQAHKQEKLL